MTAPLLLNALQIAWVRLLQTDSITDENIHIAPLKVLASVLNAAAQGESDANTLADAAVVDWNTGDEIPPVTLN